MLSSPIKRKSRGRVRPQIVPAPPPVALTLVSANYESFSATLSFDRAINVDAFNPAAIFVNDADRAMRLQGGGDYGLLDPNTISIAMGQIDDYKGSDSTLQAGADSGIVAVDNGAAWAGVSELALPFP